MQPYIITLEQPRRLVRASLYGFWDLAITHAYLAELRKAALQVASDGAKSWWVIHLGESAIQARDVAELMSQRLPGIIPPHACLAVVAAGSLQAMQAKRVVADDTHRYFTTAAAAEAWLDEQGLPA